jgi:hypothetical protein
MGLQMKTSWYQPIFAAILILLLTACNAPTPPTEFAPDGSVITKAISLQLSQTQERLSSSLSAAVPRIKLDSVNVKIDCDRSVAKELSSFFTFTVPNFKFTPAYRNKVWDGKIRLFNSRYAPWNRRYTSFYYRKLSNQWNYYGFNSSTSCHA